MENKNIFWSDSPYVLIEKDNLIKFFPKKNETDIQRLNAIARLSLYVSIVLIFYKSDITYINIFIGALIFTYYIHKYKSDNEKSNEKSEIKTITKDTSNSNIEALENQTNECTMPTKNNPFMNLTMADLNNIDEKTGLTVDRAPACDITDPKVKEEIDDKFNDGLFRDVNDIFGKMNSQRQFYTMPSTGLVNRQDDFAKWLYLNEKTCKEDQDYCNPYTDIRNNRQIFGNDFENPTNTKKDS